MRAEKMTLERFAAPVRDFVNRNARGVGGDDAVGFARGVNARHQRAFQFQIFDNDL
ncbi:MAG: hypothetical protein HDKAJFGB_01294 [Anaerolineae bacterium]|nr:hypothetical protein [Anaerolineae bacterium]